MNSHQKLNYNYAQSPVRPLETCFRKATLLRPTTAAYDTVQDPIQINNAFPLYGIKIRKLSWTGSVNMSRARQFLVGVILLGLISMISSS